MNREALKYLEERENKRARGIERLALLWDMDFKGVENLVDAMKKQLESPDCIQRQYEAAMNAEFSC